MHIHVTYLVIAVVFFLSGFLLGRRYGIHIGRAALMRSGLGAKNPELWELLHFLVVDEEKERERRSTP